MRAAGCIRDARPLRPACLCCADEPFTRKDIIHIQDPLNLAPRSVENFDHVQKQLAVSDDDEDEEPAGEDGAHATLHEGDLAQQPAHPPLGRVGRRLHSSRCPRRRAMVGSFPCQRGLLSASLSMERLARVLQPEASKTHTMVTESRRSALMRGTRCCDPIGLCMQRTAFATQARTCSAC